MTASMADTFGPKQYQLGTVRRTAEQIVEALQSVTAFPTKIEIAGSIRRGRPFVGDIDLVCCPEQKGDVTAWLERCKQKAKLLKAGDQYAVFELATGLQLDIWFAHPALPEEKDMLGEITRPATPSNFGTLLLCRTGSKEHNIYLAKLALSLGLNWNPHHGVMQAGRVIASETEEDVFRVLKLDYVKPERRER